MLNIDTAQLMQAAVLRSTLRQRMAAWPWMDAPRFAHNIEAAYRIMWRRWCQGGDARFLASQ